MKVNKKFSFSTVLALMLLVAALIFATGCQQQDFVVPTPLNIQIGGDLEKAQEDCSNGTVKDDVTGDLSCNVKRIWNAQIPGDYDKALATCNGFLIEDSLGYYMCMTDEP